MSSTNNKRIPDIQRLGSIGIEPSINHVKVDSYQVGYKKSIFKANSDPSLINPTEPLAPIEYLSEPTARCEAEERKCRCPTVLVCDDDSFQHVFYVNFFSKMIDKKKLSKPIKDYKLSLHMSGEDLIEAFKRLKECYCPRPSLVITDYNMGSDKMSGVTTAIELRKAGYDGPILLRTSEDKSGILLQHADFDDLLKEGALNNFLDKSDLKSLKEFVQNCLLE